MQQLVIKREIEKQVLQACGGYPVVSITGPRQSGKTTLCRTIFPAKPYASLEDPETLAFALNDPRRFLSQFDEGAVLDEVQRAPELFSYIQGIVDRENKMGQYILTGSAQFLLDNRITQTLAGRVSIFELLPFTIRELRNANQMPDRLDELIYNGLYPPLYDRLIEPRHWYADYIRTYVERDVRQLTAVENLSTFQTFLGLCAGRIGNILDLTSLANDAGIAPNTAKTWLSILEASYVIYLLRPHHKNFSKRLIKRPKIYFNDVGLAARLLGIKSPEEVTNHYLRGGLFECLVINEYRKHGFNERSGDHFFFWRDHKGLEVDLIIDHGLKITPIEIKSGATVTSSYFDSLKKFNALAGKECNLGIVVYGGEVNQSRSWGDTVSWRDL